MRADLGELFGLINAGNFEELEHKVLGKQKFPDTGDLRREGGDRRLLNATDNGISLLYYAVMRKNGAAVDALYSMGANFTTHPANKSNEFYGVTLLGQAVHQKDPDMVTKLFKYGVMDVTSGSPALVEGNHPAFGLKPSEYARLLGQGDLAKLIETLTTERAEKSTKAQAAIAWMTAPDAITAATSNNALVK